jgi:peptide/nickel transport system permease protein
MTAARTDNPGTRRAAHMGVGGHAGLRRSWDLWRRFRRHRLGVLGLATICALGLTAVLAARIAPAEPMALGPVAFAPPGWQHLMGTDNLGRDVFSGVVHGARVSLAVGFLATLSSVLIGIAVGGISGYGSASMDALLMRITEFFQVLPRFFLGLVIIALAGPGVGKVIFVIGILS